MALRRGGLGMLMLIAASCVSTTTSTRTWSAPPPQRDGRVEWIRENVERQEGNPVGGAAVGGIVGGLLGHAILGHSAGTLVGGAGGAAAGALASRGSGTTHTYDVAVRFDDGGERVFQFRGDPPFAVGDAVTWTGADMVRRAPQLAAAPPVAPPAPPRSGAPAPPAVVPPPPPRSAPY